jgi:hypothetical protein
MAHALLLAARDAVAVGSFVLALLVIAAVMCGAL